MIGTSARHTARNTDCAYMPRLLNDNCQKLLVAVHTYAPTWSAKPTAIEQGLKIIAKDIRSAFGATSHYVQIDMYSCIFHFQHDG